MVRGVYAEDFGFWIADCGSGRNRRSNDAAARLQSKIRNPKWKTAPLAAPVDTPPARGFHFPPRKLNPRSSFMARAVTLFTGQWADLSFDEVCGKAKKFGYD